MDEFNQEFEDGVVTDEQLESAASGSANPVTSDQELEAAAAVEFGLNTAVPCATRGVPTCS